MSNEEQKQQAEAARIARRKLFPTSTYWLTRDAGDDGALCDVIDVWTEKPTFHRLPTGGVMWLGPGDTGLEHRHASITPAQAYMEVRSGVPATERECVRCGTEELHPCAD